MRVPVFVTMLQDPIVQITVIFLFVQDNYKPILLNGKKVLEKEFL